MPLPATIDADSIIERIASGEYQSHIATKLGMPKQTLHGIISKHPGYRDALKLRNMEKLDSAQARIDDEASDLARAREAFKAAAWRAERECPGEWGNKTQLTGAEGQPLQINNIAITFVQPAQGNTIEHGVDVGVDAPSIERKS